VESNILDSITVLGVVLMEFLLSLWVEWRFENETNLTIFNDMLGKVSIASFQTLICNIFKA